MVHTLQALQSLKAIAKRLPDRPKFPDKAATARAVEALGAEDQSPASPEGSVLEQVRERILRGFDRGAKTPLVSRRDLRMAPWILWDSKRGLARHSGVLAAVIAEAEDSHRGLRNLIDAWLRHFDPADSTIVETSRAIAVIIRKSDDRRLDRWRASHERHALFDAVKGPRNVADAIVRQTDSVGAVRAEVGIDDPVQAVGRYASTVQTQCLTMSRDLLRSSDAERRLSRLLEFLAPADTLQFQDTRGEIADQLLSAWLDRGQEPGATCRSKVQGFLLQHLGDPRVRPEHWRGAKPESSALMRRWLTRASLRVFFRLLDDHALDAHWRYREAFWGACLRKEAISDAWLALGPSVHAAADAISDLRGAYGRLDGNGVSPNHAVLLMRIGSLVVCEWSHNGRLRAWKADWRNAPELGRNRYSRSALTGKGLSFPPNPVTGSGGAADGNGLNHHGAQSGHWQGSAAALLSRYSELSLRPAEWRPT